MAHIRVVLTDEALPAKAQKVVPAKAVKKETAPEPKKVESAEVAEEIKE
jgi:hypothetical protein